MKYRNVRILLISLEFELGMLELYITLTWVLLNYRWFLDRCTGIHYTTTLRERQATDTAVEVAGIERFA